MKNSQIMLVTQLAAKGGQELRAEAGRGQSRGGRTLSARTTEPRKLWKPAHPAERCSDQSLPGGCAYFLAAAICRFANELQERSPIPARSAGCRTGHFRRNHPAAHLFLALRQHLAEPRNLAPPFPISRLNQVAGAPGRFSTTRSMAGSRRPICGSESNSKWLCHAFPSRLCRPAFWHQMPLAEMCLPSTRRITDSAK
jgi:hypothetical protein